MSPKRAPLAGLSVLVVEDRYLIAAEIGDEVTRLGGQLLGPTRDIDGAERILETTRPDLAVLDVSLDGGLVYELAARLKALGVPFLFQTGYDEAVIREEWRDRPRLTKPVNARRLCEELLKLAKRA
jgi:DNA-binding response OmpR family regulator